MPKSDHNPAFQAIASSPALNPSSHSDSRILTNALGEEFSQLHQFMQSFPPTQAIVQLRNQYLDEMLRQQIAAGCKQVVIFGTEFDACADRFATPDVHFFEVGQAAIMQRKLGQLPENQSTINTTYIAGSYLQPNLIEQLEQHLFDVHLPTYFIWTDSVSSLRRGDIIALIDALRNQVHQFHLSFSYLSHQILDRSPNNPELNQTLARLKHPGISWITVFKDITTFTRALGLDLLETYTTAQLHDRYHPQTLLPSTLLHFHCICTIAKQVLSW